MERIGIENFGVVNLQGNGASGNLLLADSHGQDFLIGEGELGQYDDIAVVTLEALVLVEHEDRGQLQLLAVGGLDLLLVTQLDTDFFYVELNVALVLQGKVEEEVVAGGVDVVELDGHLLVIGADIIEFLGGIHDGPCVLVHLLEAHVHGRIEVAHAVRIVTVVLCGDKTAVVSIDEVELDDGAFADDGHDTHVLTFTTVLYRLDADNVLSRLVSDDGLAGYGDVHELDEVTGHDKGGDVLIDEDGLASFRLDSRKVVLGLAQLVLFDDDHAVTGYRLVHDLNLVHEVAIEG